MEVAVLGGGHGCYAAAADAAEAGHNVRFWRRNTEALRDIANNKAITLTDSDGHRDISLSMVTNDIAAAMDGAELILSPLPATAQEGLCAAMAPHLKDDQVVFIPPGTFGSYLMAKQVRDTGNKADVSFGDAGTLPWLVRKQPNGSTRVTTRTVRLPTGIFPACKSNHGFGVIERLFPEVERRRDVLDAALLNYGPIIHPPLILMNAGPLAHFDTWDIHNEGTQKTIRNVHDALDAERIAIREALGYFTPHFPLADHYNRDPDGDTMYSVTSHDDLVDSSDWREKIDLFNHRYMTEDIALGLAFLVSLGDWAGVPCPVADGLLAIAGAAVGRDYRVTGRTMENIGLADLGRKDIRTLLDSGLNA
ncbi:MAG: NAD/NADP octopine/nopaline dehydrogenase family protein [Pseudomonadota bacterium]|nr:NAD/NADP octopine/nopaline dehydrogenase family protein [Pseudomonadota bacterium]